MDASFAWSVEEAKLLWAQGQQAVAVRMGKSLADAAKGSRDSDVVAYARLLSLTGKWLAETRCLPLCSADAPIAEQVKFLSLATNKCLP